MSSLSDDELREWLRGKLANEGRGAKKRLADYLGLSPDMITRMLNTDPAKESRRIRGVEIDKMRSFFNEMGDKMSVDAVVGPVPISPKRVPYGGEVRAGAFLAVDEYFDQDGGDHQVPVSVMAHPGYTNISQAAWRVRGNSMDAAGIMDGMWVVAALYGEWIDKVGPIENGTYVIVERCRHGGSERELTVKEIQFNREGMRLVPRSTNPSYQEFFIPHDPQADNDREEVRILAVVLWFGRDVDPRSR